MARKRIPQHSPLTADQKLVVIVGAGFAGLNAAQSLANKKGVYVVLIDQRNHHLFQPLLYQVATAGLNPGDIAVPIRAQFSDARNVEVHWSEVDSVDLNGRTVAGKNAFSDYDYLVLACGAQHSYFGHSEWEACAPGLKTLEQATEIRRRILSAFERAENEFDPILQKKFLRFVVVGGGPTGVELAGAIADISRTVLINDFKRIDPSQAQVYLVEAGPRVLPSFSEDMSQRAERDLKELGVEVRTSSRVTGIDAEKVTIGEEVLEARNVFWAAGVQARKLQFQPDIETDKAGRVKVTKDLCLPGFPEVFVIGDMAAVEIEPGKIVPGLAPAAIQEGKHVAEQILRDLQNRPRKPFRYIDKGQMATIGKNRALVQSKKLKFDGRLAWLAWLFIHVFYLIGFKNRISVMLQWAWSYLFSKRGSRLITEKQWKLENPS